MIEVGYRVQYFFGNTSFLILLLISLLYIYIKAEEQYRKMFLITISCFFLVFNDVMFALVDKAGQSGTYYRFLWMIPISGILAILAAYMLVKVDTNIKKICCFIIIMLVILTAGDPRNIPDIRIHKMENVYNFPNEVMEIIEILDYDRKGASVVVMCPSDVIMFLRVYNGAYVSAIPRGVYCADSNYDWLNASDSLKKSHVLLEVLNGVEYDAMEFHDILNEKDVSYIICGKDNNEQYYESIGYVMLDETIQYRIYKVKDGMIEEKIN